MASHIGFKKSGLILVIFTIVVQSVPIEKAENHNKLAINQHVQKFIDVVKSATISTTTTTIESTKPTDTVSSSSLSPSKTDNKKKRDIEDENELDSFELPYFQYEDADESFDHRLRAKVQETKAKIHDNPDDSKVFSDIKMSPSELTTIVRRRRSTHLSDALSSRRKRALSSYDFYDTDSFYDPYLDALELDRYARSFAPLYWYPSVYQRNIRSNLSPNSPIIYSPMVQNNDIDENPLPFYDDENDDNDDDDDDDSDDDLPVGGRIEQILNEADGEDDTADDQEQDDNDELFFPMIYQRRQPYIGRYESYDTYF